VSGSSVVCSPAPLHVAASCAVERANPKSAILQIQFESSRTLDGCKHGENDKYFKYVKSTKMN
jgi:hypothetical protein